MMGCVKEGDGGLKGAYEDKNRETFFGGAGGSTDPFPEDCSHCLNRGGTLAQCGILIGGAGTRNYDQPLSGRRCKVEHTGMIVMPLGTMVMPSGF